MAGFRITTLAVALSALVTGVQAAHASTKVAVLGLEVVDGGEGLDQQTTQRAAWLTEELRAYAAADTSPLALAPGSNRDLLEMKLLSGCADEAVGCMATIGRELNAERLLYGKLQKGSDSYEVTLTLFDTEAPRVVRKASDRIPFTEASRSAMRAWGRSLYNELTGVSQGGVLVVETNAGSGTVFVDGRPHASLESGTARVDDLEEGIHTVSIEADGYAPYAERVTIVPGEEEAMAITLDPLQDAAGDSRGGYRIAFGAALATAGVSTGAWGFTFYQFRYALQEDKERAVDELRTLGSDEDYGPNDNVCASAERDLASTDRDIAAAAGDLVNTCDKGDRNAVLAPIFGTAAAVSALAAGYFYYKGYGSGGSGGAEKAAEDGEAWSLQVAPRFGPDLVGAGLRLEF